MTDSERYDFTTDELQSFVLGLLTAARIDAATATEYWEGTFAEAPLPAEDSPSYQRLTGRVIWMLLELVNTIREEPEARPHVERILDALRNGEAFGS